MRIDADRPGMPEMPTCELCHPDPDVAPHRGAPLMPFCVECHAKMKRDDCGICHRETTRETRPLFQGSVRIAHDDAAAWEEHHIEAYRNDAAFCGYCHADRESSCGTCHPGIPAD